MSLLAFSLAAGCSSKIRNFADNEAGEGGVGNSSVSVGGQAQGGQPSAAGTEPTSKEGLSGHSSEDTPGAAGLSAVGGAGILDKGGVSGSAGTNFVDETGSESPQGGATGNEIGGTSGVGTGGAVTGGSSGAGGGVDTGGAGAESAGGTGGALTPECGDGNVDPTEGCDDGDLEPGDGCDDLCTVEAEWNCTGSPSQCTNPCNADPCENQGTCSPAGDGFSCNCSGGWRGETCGELILTLLEVAPSYSECEALTVSGDGNVAAGWCGGTEPSVAVRWDALGAATVLPVNSGTASATGASYHGNAVVGRLVTGPVAALWSAAIPPATYPGENGGTSQATRVNADGTLIVGTAQDANGRNRAVYWRTTDTIVAPVPIDPETRVFNTANGVSADGAVIVGHSNMGPTSVAFRWENDSWVELPNTTSGATSFAAGVSDDGEVTVGYSGGQACRWIRTAAPELLGVAGIAYAASADGSTIVGVIGNTVYPPTLAFVWDATNGVRSLDDVLTGLEVELDGWSLQEATDVSDNGSVIVGWAVDGSDNHAAWMVNLAGTSE